MSAAAASPRPHRSAGRSAPLPRRPPQPDQRSQRERPGARGVRAALPYAAALPSGRRPHEPPQAALAGGGRGFRAASGSIRRRRPSARSGIRSATSGSTTTPRSPPSTSPASTSCKGGPADVCHVAEETLAIFQSYNTHREAIAALLVFSNAARMNEAGLEPRPRGLGASQANAQASRSPVPPRQALLSLRSARRGRGSPRAARRPPPGSRPRPAAAGLRPRPSW